MDHLVPARRRPLHRLYRDRDSRRVVYAIGAYGFFAVPYTIIIYPFLYLTMPRLWAVSRKHGYMTAGDFVLGRYGNRWLELAVALTGILATMPYIALQLVGLEKVISALGFTGQGSMPHAPITIAFVILALYTYKSGLRAPAMIAFVKDAMIYIFIIAAIVVIPYRTRRLRRDFRRRAGGLRRQGRRQATASPPASRLAPAQVAPYITLAIGSAMALFMYPHAMTGALAAVERPRDPLQHDDAAGLFLRARPHRPAGRDGARRRRQGDDPQDAVPQLVLWAFPDWFAGFCFAAIALGALVPAAVMSIGAANTFTRNIWKPFIHPQMTPREELVLAKLVSLIVKVGALMVIFFVPTQFALDLQLLGGVWMVQIFPAMILGLYTRWFSGWALLVGWAVGMIVGTSLSWGEKAWTPVHALGGTCPLSARSTLGLGFAAYNGLTAVSSTSSWRGYCPWSCGRGQPTKPRRKIMTIAVWDRPIVFQAEHLPKRFELSLSSSARLRGRACLPKPVASAQVDARGRRGGTSRTRGSFCPLSHS